MSHTKGPWEWNPKLRDILAQSERGDEVDGARYWRTIADLELTGPSPRHEVETDANGRLIAAAPIMLDALAEIVVKSEDLTMDADELVGYLRGIAEGAVAKARGEAS